MVSLKSMITKLGCLGVLAIFTQCATSQKIEDIQQVTIKQAYYQEWVAGVKGGGTGINLYIPLSDQQEGMNLKYAYFRGYKIKLNKKPNENVYVGKYQNQVDDDKIMSSDPKKEYTNKVPHTDKIPFELKGDQCVIAYEKEGKEEFLKIEKLNKKELEAYPMQRPQ